MSSGTPIVHRLNRLRECRGQSRSLSGSLRRRAWTCRIAPCKSFGSNEAGIAAIVSVGSVRQRHFVGQGRVLLALLAALALVLMSGRPMPTAPFAGLPADMPAMDEICHAPSARQDHGSADHQNDHPGRDCSHCLVCTGLAFPVPLAPALVRPVPGALAAVAEPAGKPAPPQRHFLTSVWCRAPPRVSST
jgi:hypothetical protein